MAFNDKLAENKTTQAMNGRNLIKPELLELLQYRINEEEKSSRIYANMVLYFENTGYVGAAKVWQKYSEEEMIHANWAKEYLLSLGIKPQSRALPELPDTFTGLKEIIYISFNHELEITRQCQELASAALTAGDHLLYRLAMRYLEEQIEEQDKFQTLIDQLETFGDDKVSLRLLDNYLTELFN